MSHTNTERTLLFLMSPKSVMLTPDSSTWRIHWDFPLSEQHTVDGGNIASFLTQMHAILLRLAPRPLLNIGAQFGQVGLGHARFRPLTTSERFCSSQLNVK